MSWLSALFGGLFNMTDKMWSQFAPLTNQQKQQNAFNASEAQKGRDFSAQQAELERDWQEEMYAQYNSISGKIEQARQAGVNPLYAVTGSASTPMQAHGPAVSAPVASSSGLASSPMGMAGDVLQFSKLKAEIDQMNAYTRQANANATNAEIDSMTRGALNELNMASIVQTIATSKADEGYKVAKTGEVAHLIMNADADTAVKTQQLSNMVADLANTEADTRLKNKQYDSVVSQIANTDMDTQYKASLILLTGAQTRSERYMAGLISQNTHLSRQQRKESEARVKSIYQQYDHNEIIQSLQRASADLDYRNQLLHTPKNAFEASIKWLLEAAVEVVSFGGYTSYNTSRSYNTTTTTVVDGNDYPTRGKIGF